MKKAPNAGSHHRLSHWEGEVGGDGLGGRIWSPAISKGVVKPTGVGMTLGGCSDDAGLEGRRCSVEAVARSVAGDDGLDGNRVRSCSRSRYSDGGFLKQKFGDSFRIMN